MGISKKGPEPLSRAERKSKKRKAEDAIPDLPGDNVEEQVLGGIGEAEKHERKRRRSDDNANVAEVAADIGNTDHKTAKREKKRKRKEEGDVLGLVEADASNDKVKKSKKGKKDRKEGQNTQADDEGSDIMEDIKEPPEPRKTKKERKAERKAREAAEAAEAAESVATGNKNPVAAKPAALPATDANSMDGKKSKKNNRNREKKRKAKVDGEDETKPARFIVFIGMSKARNLPYSATTESITKHFASIKPKSVRHLTKKDNPAQSRGSAFVEFDGYDHMKTCLKLFHHSLFDDGISPARKINVELTAGGGGNTKDRRTKIEEKNQKLNEQRTRRIQEEEKAKFAKTAGTPPDESGIHPSRRALVPGI